jgi:hypothetical protein
MDHARDDRGVSVGDAPRGAMVKRVQVGDRVVVAGTAQCGQIISLSLS